MKKVIALVLYYTKENRYSFNALIGSVEKEKELLDKINIYFIIKKEELFEKLDSIVKEYKRIIVAFSFFTTQVWDMYSIIKNLKEKYKKPIYIAGGPHPTGEPIKTLKMGFDVVAIGEAEDTFIEFLKKIKDDKDYRDIKGIAFLDEDGNFVYKNKDKKINLDEYYSFATLHNKFGPIEIKRGCLYFCNFCQTPYIFGTSRHRGIESILKHVYILKKNNLLDIRFISPSAFSYGSNSKTVNIPILEELLKNIRKIIKSDGRIFIGTFPSEVRPEHINKDTIELILKYADNDNLVIGAQSGSQRILDICNRSHTVNDIYNAVELILKAKLKANVDFIFGLPYEEDEDINLTLKVIKDLINMGAKIHAHTFMPLPQTPFKTVSIKSLDEDFKKIIKKLSSNSFIYGNWEKQEMLSKKIREYLTNGT